MTTFKQSLTELKQSTPKHIQWLLMAAAFIVVVVLLILLLHGGKKNADTTTPIIDSVVAVLMVDPDSLDWSNTHVGSTQVQRFVVSANAPIKIDDVRLSKDMPGLAKPKTTCTNIGQINSGLSCTINLEYKPSVAAEVSGASMFIDWRGANQPVKMNQSTKIAIAIGAIADAPKPVVKPEPVVEPIATPKTQMAREIEKIAEPLDMDFDEPEPAAPVKQAPVKPVTAQAPASTAAAIPSDACSDFAFAGYNAAGQQIGWIKPSRGGYNFHTFADRNCQTPSGTYNPDNGVITDATGKRLGTDAERIGFGFAANGALPQLSNPTPTKSVNRARQLSSAELVPSGGSGRVFTAPPKDTKMLPSSFGKQSTVSSRPYDRTFVLRQYKPIPATIVSEIRAVAGETRLPVTATVDRHVYSDNGRTIIIPAGTMMLGSVVGDMPGPYKSIGRIGIEWYRFVRPDGVEFNFNGNRPFSGDAQGRTGVPGRGSTDYMEQFVMPMLTAIVPAAVNMIAPISDKFINQIDLDNNTVTQTGTVRSSELAKNEIVTAWNKVAQKLLVDMMDNTVPPFSIASGTRITVFSPTDLIVTCGLENGKKCAITEYSDEYAATEERNITIGVSEPETLVGQVRSFNLDQYCDGKGGVSASASVIGAAGLDYRTVVFYCQSAQYKAVNQAKQEAVFQNQQSTSLTGKEGQKMEVGSKEYNEKVLGLKYNDDGTIKNPFQKEAPPPVVPTIKCPEDGSNPDANGCCTGETYTDMGDQGFNCCPAGGGDCFPPIK